MRDPEFAQQFLALRKARGLTQRAAADLLHTTVPTIQNWEQSRSTPWEKYRDRILLTLVTAVDSPISLLCGAMNEPENATASHHKRYMTGIYNALAEGRKAYANQIPRERNPYKRYDMRKCWSDGWDEALRNK